jgi:pyruvate/2-oxoglutarate dehydrogenase complex dihydrolipoamide acyltransferase (E2) component
VDLSQLAGSGPDGRITREDVLAAAEAEEEAPEFEVPAEAASEVVESRVEDEEGPSDAEADEDHEPEHADLPGDRRRLSKIRRTIAQNMAQSWAEIPHVTTFDEVEASRLLAARRALISRHDLPVSIDAMAVKAVIPALEAFPEFNSTLDGDSLVVHESVDIGVAVDTPDGLVVVVVRKADSLGLIELSQRIGRLADGARERSLSHEELTGQTFTVSNIGALGGGYGTPIVPPGTTAILSVGRAVERPIAKEGRVLVAPMMALSLSYDHRVIDGGTGRRFMAMVLENLQEPALFLAS